MSYDRNKVIAVAEAEVGYLEKATNSDLDDKTANAGNKNYTKYARDLAAYPFYNGSKSGVAWCDVFVDWCFVQAYGLEAAKKLTCQTMAASKNCGAGCKYSRQYYRNNNQLFDSPEIGDQIFFYSSDKSSVSHTGLVYKVDSSYVYTIEGNTSGASGVIANGGGVCKKKYRLTYNRLAGFGRPDWNMDGGSGESSETSDASVSDMTASVETEDTSAKTAVLGSRTLKSGSSGEDVKELQEALNRLPCITAKLTVDGKYGSATASAVKTFQKAYSIQADGKYGPESHKTLTAALAELDAQADKSCENAQVSADNEQTAEAEAAEKEVNAGQVRIVCASGSVNIRRGNGTQYERITSVKNGKTFEWIATAENGWHAIVISGQVGWVSGKYSARS